MYSTHNKEKSVIAERFIRTFKNKNYKYMTSISKNVYTDKLDDTITIVHKYNNTYHSTNKMKPVEVKLIKKILNLKLVIMLEYQNIKLFYKRLHSKSV